MRILFVSLSITIFIAAPAFAVKYSESNNGNKYFTDQDSLEADRMKYMNEAMTSIKGKEKLPADSVFKNLKVIKGASNISAEHPLWMMNWGWSAELV